MNINIYFIKMTKTRNSSYTLCKGLIKEIINKNKNVRNINLDIIDISEHIIKTTITIDGKMRTFDINLEKRKKKNKSEYFDNLKNQKNDNIFEDHNKCGYTNNVKIENNNNKKNKMDINDEKTNILNNENKKINNVNIKQVDQVESEYYDESEPEDEYDYKDPHFTKYPDEFKCEDCYETNVEKGKLFNYAQEMIDKFNVLEEENNRLKKMILIKNDGNNNYLKIEELKKKLESQEDHFLSYINNINDKFIDSILINHKSFNSIKDILLTLEKANPKKVPELINKNINTYIKQIQDIVKESDELRKEYSKITKEAFGDKINI